MAQQISGGYDFVIKGNASDHSCPICLELIRNTVELPCTHIACEGCLLRHEKSKFPSKCPKCRNPYKENEKQRVRSTDRFIRNSIDIECKQTKDGCKWIGCIGDYEDSHSARCEFAMFECFFLGCGEKYQRRNFKTHLQMCRMRITCCVHCNGMMKKMVMEDHLKECPMRPVQCTNTSCNKTVKRRELENHCKEKCKFQKVECPYHEIGCQAQLLRMNVTTHCRNCNDQHTMLLMQNHITLTKKNSELEKKNTVLESKLKESDKKIAGLEEKVKKSDVTGPRLDLLTYRYGRMKNELRRSDKGIDELRLVSAQLKSDHEEMEKKLSSEKAIEEIKKDVNSGKKGGERSNTENVQSTTLGEVNEIKSVKRRHTLDVASAQFHCAKRIRF